MLKREEVYKILNNAYKPFILSALELVNLKEKEKKAIELVDLMGFSELKASELMNCSVNSVKNYRKKALDKMAKAWSSNKEIIETLREV